MSEFNLRDYQVSDTIAAPATSPSKSALGVIKISGKKALAILDKVFLPKTAKDMRRQKSFTLHYGWIVKTPKSKTQSLKSGEVVDEVLVSIMKAPRSYTTEDIVEISFHGGVAVLEQILALVLKKGARLAKPGEFTWRALINGRIDLLQAESILRLVEAKTPEAVFLSSKQLQGSGAEKIYKIKEELKNLFVSLESAINFPEEETNLLQVDIKKTIRQTVNDVSKLRKGQKEAGVFSQGLRCVICGRANSGKSTLFNRLLDQERAIVSKTPGTTRDVIEETLNVKGVPVKVYDTAGILEPKDFVTKKALAKTSQAFDQADLVILLFDGSKKINKDDKFFLRKTKGKNTILVVNKKDLPQKASFNGEIQKNHKLVEISALKDRDLDKFKRVVYQSIYSKDFKQKDLVFLSQYQKKELDILANELNKVLNYLEQGFTLDFINFSLKNCLDSIGKITGEVYSEEILESIFSNFCIGK